MLTVASSWQNMPLRSNTRCVFPIKEQGCVENDTSFLGVRTEGGEREIEVRNGWSYSLSSNVLAILHLLVIFSSSDFLVVFSLFSLPSSSVQWCWEQSWPGRYTQKMGTPQNATDGIGTCAGFGACNGLGAWHWWQSLCMPSKIKTTGETKREEKKRRCETVNYNSRHFCLI